MPMMAPQDLESELKKDPFQPFRIVTTDGKTYDITERDRPLLLVGKRTVIIGLRVPERLVELVVGFKSSSHYFVLAVRTCTHRRLTRPGGTVDRSPALQCWAGSL